MLNYTPMTNVDHAVAVARKLNEQEREEFYERMLEVAPEMSASERAALDAEIERSLDQVEAGRFVDADDVIAKLRARSA